MFDPTAFTVGGVSLIATVFGLTEFLKSLFKIEGKWATALAAVLGAVLMGLYQLQSSLAEPYSQIYTAVIVSLTFGLAASGFYKWGAERFPKLEE